MTAAVQHPKKTMSSQEIEGLVNARSSEEGLGLLFPCTAVGSGATVNNFEPISELGTRCT